MKRAICYPGLLALPLLCADVARACASSTLDTPARGFERAAAVFTGKVVEAAGEGRWVVAAGRVWEGDVEERITLLEVPTKEREMTWDRFPAIGAGAAYLFLAGKGRPGARPPTARRHAIGRRASGQSAYRSRRFWCKR